MVIDSPFNVSSKDSMGFLRDFDKKFASEIDGTDLTSLFEESVFSPSQALLELPKDLLSLVNDYGIFLV